MDKLQFFLFLGVASAGISLQAFDEQNCTGNLIANVQSNSGNPEDSSNCVPMNAFQSIGISTADTGFQCNIYSDNNCQSIITSVSAASTCSSNVSGQSVVCFNQALFDNQFAETTAEVTVGSSIVTTDGGGNVILQQAVTKGCGQNGCDPQSPFTSGWSHFNKDGQFSMVMQGNYDNSNQRDYMANILGKALDQATTNRRQDLTGSAEDDDNIMDMPAFVQVVMNDANGNNQAQMSATLSVNVLPTKKGDCDGIVGEVTSAALGAIPEVGGLLAKAFTITCQASG